MTKLLSRFAMAMGALMGSLAFAQEPVLWLDTTGNPLAKGLQMRMSYPKRGLPSDFQDKDDILNVSFPKGDVLESMEMKVYLVDGKTAGDIFPVKGAKDPQIRHAYVKKMWGSNSPDRKLLSIKDRYVDGKPAIEYDESMTAGKNQPVYLVRRTLRVFYQDRLVDLTYNVGSRPENRQQADAVFAQAETGLYGQTVNSIHIAGIESSLSPRMTSFDSTGLQQAKGVRIRLVYPESWQRVKEGTENTVFMAYMHRGSVEEKLNLAIYGVPAVEINDLFAMKDSPATKVRHERWKKMLATHGEVISLIQDRKVDGQPAVLVERSPGEGGNVRGVVKKSHALFIYHPKGLVSLTCAVTGKAATRQEVQAAFSTVEKGVCRPVFDSVVFAERPSSKTGEAASFHKSSAMAVFDTAGHPHAGAAHVEVRYPQGWQSRQPKGNGGILELARRHDHVVELMELKMADLSEDDALLLFGTKKGLSQKTRLETMQKYMKDAKDIKVISLRDTKVDGQPAVLLEFEKVHAYEGMTFFVRAKALYVHYGEKLVLLTYLAGSKPKYRTAVLKQFAEGEREAQQAYFMSLRLLNKEEMLKRASEKNQAVQAAAVAYALFDATGNPKAKGARVRLLMPVHWKSNLSPGEDTVEERAVADGLLVKGVALNVSGMDDAANQAIFAREGGQPEEVRHANLKKMYRAGLTLHAFHATDGTFKGRPTIVSDLDVSQNMGVMVMYMKTRVLDVYDGERRISVLCSTVGPEEKKEDIDQIHPDHLKKNCSRIFDSLEFAE